MNFLIPVILVVISGGLFFTWIDPQYNEIKSLQVERARYDETLARTAEIRDFRRNVQAKFNAISTEDLTRVEKLLPSRIDNIKLILDINTIADRNGMIIRDIRIDRKDGGSGTGRETIEVNDENIYGTVGFSFSVVSTYDNFKKFIDDLSLSLRIIDVTSVAISPIPEEVQFYRFDVGIQTYWLKSN